MISPRTPIDLIIFDFDGTLIDTAPDLIRATNLYLESRGVTPLRPEVIRNEIGMGLRKLIADLYPEHHGEETLIRRIEQEFLTIYEKEFLNSPVLYPGLRRFLGEWEREVAIVSNKRTRFIQPILKKVGLDTHPWRAIIGGDTLTTMKPHPAPFLAAMAAAGATPETTLIVGDGFPDVHGAVAVGSRCVAVEFGYTNADQLMAQGAWKKIASFEDLLPLIRSIT
jgi:HAD superfamily hydrolase (TIGR01509 family)